MAILKSVAAKVLPGLKPNHPKNKIKVPRTTIERLCPEMAFGVPSELNLPILGPSIIAPASATYPPIPCTTPEPAKSSAPNSLNQPPPHSQCPYIG